jgi:hypothetical protein
MTIKCFERMSSSCSRLVYWLLYSFLAGFGFSSLHLLEAATKNKLQDSAYSSLQELNSFEYHAKEFLNLISQYKTLPAKESLELTERFLSQYPLSKKADCVHIIAAQSCILLHHDEKALDHLLQIKAEKTQLQVLDEKLRLLIQMKEYEQAYNLKSSVEKADLNPTKLAHCYYYLAQALFLPLKNTPTDSQEQFFQKKLSQALEFLVRSQNEMGYQANFCRAQITKLLGRELESAELYILASQQPSADSASCLYEAANLLNRNQQQNKAYNILWPLTQQTSVWQAQACLLWLELSLDLRQAKSFLEQKEILKKAFEYDAFKTLSLQILAYLQVNQVEEAAKVLLEILRAPIAHHHLESLQKNLMTVTQCLSAHKRTNLITEILKLYSLNVARDTIYYEATYELALRQQELLELDSALQSFSCIVVQFPDFHKIANSLLQKGLLENQLERYIQSWSSLNLYLRAHADQSGSLQAWPAYLQVSLQLKDYPDSKSLNEHRLQLVFQHLQQVDIETGVKKQWIEDLVHPLFQQDESKIVSFLNQIKIHCSELLSPLNELLLAIGQVHVDSVFPSFIKRADQIISQASTHDQPKLLKPYIEELFQLSQKYEGERSLFYDQAASKIWQAFNVSPKLVTSSDLNWFVDWQENQIKTKKPQALWNSYFKDEIYSVHSYCFAPIELDQYSKEAAKRAQKVLKYLINNKSTPNSLSALTFRSARLAWLLQDFKQAIEGFNVVIYQDPDKELKNSSLAYMMGAYQLDGQPERVVEVGQKLVQEIRHYEDSFQIWARLQLTTAKEAMTTSYIQAKSPKDSSELASKLLNELNLPVSKFLNFAQFTNELEIMIERSYLRARLNELLGQTPQTQFKTLLQDLRAIKIDHYESEEILNAAQSLHEDSFDVRRSNNYGLLLDAMIAQQELKYLDPSSAEYSIKKDLSQNLYRVLQDPQYSLNPYIYKKAALELRNFPTIN